MKKFILLSALLTMSVVVFSQVPPPVSITKETFGTECWDTETCGDHPAPAASPGHHHHWDFNDVTTFTSTNGTWRGGSDSSIRINNYIDGNVTPSYPGASDGMHLGLVAPTTNSGSWDTVVFSGIEIDGYSGLSVNFGYSKRNFGAVVQTNGVVVNVRVDGGPWTMLDTTVFPVNHPLATWTYIEMDIPEAIQGDLLDIMFSSTRNAFALDDIEVTGRAKPISRTKETFGTECWDTETCGDHPAPAASPGHHHHWDFNDITTFTSTNGTWRGGSDSSIRINNYIDGNVTPTYPGASDGMHLGLVAPTTNSGSWDTVIFSGIDVEGYYGYFVKFGYSKRNFGAVVQTNGVVVNVRVDGGSWTMLDTTVFPVNHPLATWTYITMQIPLSVVGSELDIMFSSTRNAFALDDIEVFGRPIGDVAYVEEIIVLSADGNSSGLTIDTDGETMAFQAIILPSNAESPLYTWSVTDPLLGSISSGGVFTPRKNGTVGIIASANDREGLVADTVWVELTNQIVPAESVTIEASDTTLITAFGQTIQFVATVLPEDATNRSVTWSIADKNGDPSNYGEIDENGLFTPGFRSVDTVVVTATTVDGGFRDSEVVTITLPVVAADDLQDADVKIHPNEVTDIVNVEGQRIHEVHMLNLQGSVVRSVENVRKRKKISVDVSDVASGFYLVKVNTLDGKIATKKIVKK